MSDTHTASARSTNLLSFFQVYRGSILRRLPVLAAFCDSILRIPPVQAATRPFLYSGSEKVWRENNCARFIFLRFTTKRTTELFSWPRDFPNLSEKLWDSRLWTIERRQAALDECYLQYMWLPSWVRYCCTHTLTTRKKESGSHAHNTRTSTNIHYTYETQERHFNDIG